MCYFLKHIPTTNVPMFCAFATFDSDNLFCCLIKLTWLRLRLGSTVDFAVVSCPVSDAGARAFLAGSSVGAWVWIAELFLVQVYLFLKTGVLFLQTVNPLVPDL